MTRVLVWKELREQALSLVALIVLGAGLIVCRDVFAGPGVERDQTDELIAIVMAWVCGLIAGVQPIAAEREAGTFPWLDGLPVSRRRIWIGKAQSAAAGVAVQSAALLLVIVLLGHAESLGRAPEVFLFLAITAANGLAFGLFGSALARTPMGAIGWALLSEFVMTLAVLIFSVPLQNYPIWGIAICVSLALLPALPAFVSYRVFTRPDRLRRRTAGRLAAHGHWRAIFWLVWRQVRWFHVVMLIVGLVITSILPRTEPIAWPFFGLVLGAMLGVSAFAPDHLGGAVRYLGDRRLPLGRLWLVKVGLPLVTLGVIVLLILLNIALMFMAQTYSNSNTNLGVLWQTMGFDRLVTPAMILLGPVYGFAVGQFSGFVCRKGAVAGVLAMLTAAGLVVVWLPSMIVGGLAIWQWLIPPVVLIAATRLAMRPWVAGRLSDWRPVAGIAGAGLLALGGIAFGIWWRVIEVPDVGPPFDAAAFLASAPTPEHNEAGAKMRQAAEQFSALLESKRARAGVPGANSPQPGEHPFFDRARDQFPDGWPADDAGLNDWMDQVFAGTWVGMLREAVALPQGIVSFPWPPTNDARGYIWFGQMCQLLRARALQLQARGEQVESLAMFRLALDAMRQLRHRTSVVQYQYLTLVENGILRTLPLWAAKTVDRPDLLREALGMLGEHELALPPFTETIETAYEIARQHNAFIDTRESHFSRDLQVMAYFTPWERDRSARILNLMFAGWMRAANLDFRTALQQAEWAGTTALPNSVLNAWLPSEIGDAGRRQREKLFRLLLVARDLSPFWCPDAVFSLEPRNLAYWRAARIQIALLLYEKEKGEPAKQLADLVPAILPDVPIDPFDGKAPFLYRVSKGEQITMHPDWPKEVGVVAVAPGQGVVWSVSTDLVDNGGLRDGGYWQGFGRGQPGYDLIFVVPRPAKK